MSTQPALTFAPAVQRAWLMLCGRSRFPWFLCLNVFVLLYFVPPVSLFIFFAISVALIDLRNRALESFGERVKGWSNSIAALLLTVALLLLRDLDWAAKAGMVSWEIQDALQIWQISAIGMSYCWLRVLYVLFAEEKLTPYEFTRYYFFAPTFMSGPIMSPEQYLEQAPAVRWRDIQAGVARLALGGGRFMLAVALQQCMPVTSAETMRHAANTFSTGGLWLVAFTAGIWLYLNFAAFMDISIGASRIIGIHVPENFNNPFAACSITDFWRRWHITLGLWLRVHVFSPVAREASKHLPPTSLIIGGTSALLTMLVCGLWHKPTVCYLIWGGLHGVGLIAHLCWAKWVHPSLGSIRESKGYLVCAWLTTHAYVALTWIFFFPAGESDFFISTALALRMFGLT